MKDYKKALESHRKALDAYQKGKIPDGMMLEYQNIALTYSLTGKYKEAYDYHVMYSALRDSLSFGDKLADMEARYGKEKSEKEIALLKKENEINDLELERKQMIIYAGVIGGF